MTTSQWSVSAQTQSLAGPFRHGGDTHRDILRAWMLAASIVGACGVVLFGMSALMILLVAIVSALAAEMLCSFVIQKPIIGGMSHAGLTGLLLGLTLPATVEWYVPMFGAIIAIVFGKSLFGGLGHYIWQPALVGRVVIGFLFASQMSMTAATAQAPVLAPGSLLVGDLGDARPVNPGTYRGWFAPRQAHEADAFLMKPPVYTLRRFAVGDIEPQGDLIYEVLIRDYLPPWKDTVFGTVPGAIGETCVLALIVAGLYLVYRGYLRWQLPVMVLASAGLAASLLPVETAGANAGYDWFPAFAVENGRAVGCTYVLYHLTSGQLMLGAFLLAGDTMATPMRARGQIQFAIGVGVLTIFMRLYGVVDGECYWAILIMNSLVAVIDRHSKRPILGMAPA